MKPFTELMDVILSPLKSAAINGAANLASGIGTTVQLGITLYIILYGWQIARGEIAEPWNEFAKRAVKLGLIVALIQSAGLYKEYVIDFLAEQLPDALSNSLSGNPVPDANVFDTLAAKFGILLTQVWQGTGWSAPAATARAAVVTLLVMPFVWGSLIVGFVVTMWAKAGMYFVAALGPLFIALAMFEQTRKYLHNWLDQIVTMIALQVLVAMTCGLVIQGLERAVKDAPTPETVFALAGKVIVLAVFSLAIWSSLPRLASKLGGYGTSLAGAGSRAAPLETMRAPLASFTEHGAGPIGRPELATISSRGGDERAAAPIMPSAVVAATGNGSSAPSPATGSRTSIGGTDPGVGAAHTAAMAAMMPGRAQSGSTATASSIAVDPVPAHRFDTGLDVAPGSTIDVGTPPTGHTTGAPGQLDRGVPGDGQSMPMSAFAANAATAPTTVDPSASGTVFAATEDVRHRASDAPTSIGTPDETFDTLMADQRTGFEDMEFEAQPSVGAAGRASDGIAGVASPIPIDAHPAPAPARSVSSGSDALSTPPTTRRTP